MPILGEARMYDTISSINRGIRNVTRDEIRTTIILASSSLISTAIIWSARQFGVEIYPNPLTELLYVLTPALLGMGNIVVQSLIKRQMKLKIQQVKDQYDEGRKKDRENYMRYLIDQQINRLDLKNDHRAHLN